jgi:hypothetical protein
MTRDSPSKGASRLGQLVLLGFAGCCTRCSQLVDFEGYRLADAGPSSDAGGISMMETPADLRSFYFERGAASFTVLGGGGLLAGSSDETGPVVAGSFASRSGGGVEVDATGGFVYTPPGATGAFWGDDYFEYTLERVPSQRYRARLTVQPNVVHLNELAAAGAGFGIAGADVGDAIGFEKPGAAGDINGDGFEDFVLGAGGAYTANPGDVPFTQGRAVYVVFGGNDARELSLDELLGQGTRGFAILGDEDDDSFDSFGWVATGAGDVNGDGLDDLIIGIPGAGPEARVASFSNARGAALVVFGKGDGEPVHSADILAGRGGGFAILPPDDYRLTGIDASGAGDVDGDGLADVIVGAPIVGRDSSNQVAAAEVVFGKRGPEPVHLEDITAGRSGGFAIIGTPRDSLMGLYVAGVGDVNGDGLSDVIAGSPGYPDPVVQMGRDAVIFGKRDVAPVLLAELESSSERGFFIVGSDSGDFLGLAAAGGDVNGDGLDDILVASSIASFGPSLVSDETPPQTNGAGTPDAGNAAEPSDAGSGQDAGAGVNMAPPAPIQPQAQRGMVYVVFGKREPGDIAVAELEKPGGAPTGFAIAGTVDSQGLGLSISSGDVNGDGLSDVVTSNTPLNGLATSYVVFGKTDTDPVLLPVGRVAPQGAGLAVIALDEEVCCRHVVSGADVNGDGLDDLLFEARGYAHAPQNAGGAYVVYAWDMSRSLVGRDRALIGSSSADTFDLPPSPVVIVRGGHGTDTLRVGSTTRVLDLTLPGRYQSLEIIDVRGAGPQEILLDDAALRRIPENQFGFSFGLARRLTILGDGEDTVRFDRTGFSERGVNAGRLVYGRDGAYYGLEVSRALQIQAP